MGHFGGSRHSTTLPLSSCLVLIEFLLFVSGVKGQSCGPRVSARLLTVIPCDMTKSSYCTAPGSAYPWNSVRRYIFENQGLIRRMYGDERYSSVLRHEMDHKNMRYEPFSNLDGRLRRGRKRTGKETKPNRRRPKPQIFRDETTKLDSPNTDETIFRIVTQTSIKVGSDPTTDSLTTKTMSTDPKSSPVYDSTTTTYTTSRGSDITLDEWTPIVDQILETPSDTQMIGSEDETASTESVTGTHSSQLDIGMETSLPPSTTETSRDSSFGAAEDYDYFPLTRVEIISDNSVERKSYGEENPILQVDAYDIETESYAAKEETIEAETKTTEAPTPKQGINACPVKNEVIAPYWANNTRGETLALLNVYPFEQYVHSEKCAFENHQMLCREGCRCEQQYRLHRLLAFDPRNECRGIFSDWFRFPSCCVCICYDYALPDPPLSRGRNRKARMRRAYGPRG